MAAVGARRAAVLGSPVAHSLSPVLHAAAYRLLDLDWAYTAHRVEESGLAAFLAGLGAGELAGDWAGLSLTMPLKRAAIDLCTSVGVVAERAGAVNTLVFGTAGEISGENTDVPGMVNALAEAGVRSVPGAAVLGGGATAASSLVALAGVCSGPVQVLARTPARAAGLVDLGARVGLEVTVLPWTEAAPALAAPLIVATAPAGAADALAGVVPTTPGVLFDVLYDPWPTPLAAAWAARGGPVLGGLDLLVHQAVLQVELMTGQRLADPAAVLAAMHAAGGSALAARVG